MSMLKIGQTFTSYFDEYKKTFFCDFAISDCQTLNVDRKKYQQKLKNTLDSLKCYFLKLKCVHGRIHKKCFNNEQQRSTS